MSYVSNVILSFSILEDDEARIDEINNIIRELNDRPGFLKEQPHCGGTKALERPTFIGAFNYLPLPEFVRRVRALHWKEPHLVQVHCCDQEEDIYTERMHQRPYNEDDDAGR